VSRHEFEEMVKILGVVSETVGEISHKFGEFESNMKTEMNNINARILMLESSVRVLKDNL
jgi:hypothetical protein